MHDVLENAARISYQKFRLPLPEYRRFLFADIINAQDKIIGIYGSRGVGKTTLMLQVANEMAYEPGEILYIACDHPLFSDVSLYDFVEYFQTHGGKCILIDEIHEAGDFERALKVVYDFVDIKVIFSGSSAVQLTNASFARRYAMYKLPILSLREFIEIQHGPALPAYAFETLVKDHETIANDIIDQLREEKVLKRYNDYLAGGAYPYYFVDPQSYFQKITDSINTILYTEVALLYNVSATNIEQLKKLLLTICVSKPLELSMENLARTVGITKATLYKYIDYLHRAELIRHVTHEGKRFKALQKPDKLYLSNTNLFPALCMKSEVGTLRETFFAAMVSQGSSLYYASQGDFLVDEKYTVEIGGRKKGYEQIKDIPDSIVVADEIETGYGRKIPLWLFGFLY